jgi:beta-phosphoglucomutase-like phosphatase (HAD superfamily)
MKRNFYFKEPFLRMLQEQAFLMVFDMNGLIIDDEVIQRRSVNDALKALYIELSEREWIEDCVGRRAAVYLQSTLQQRSIPVDREMISELVAEKNRRYHFEDSEQGAAACFGAGIPCIAVPKRYTINQVFSRARCIVDNLTQEAKVHKK